MLKRLLFSFINSIDSDELNNISIDRNVIQLIIMRNALFLWLSSGQSSLYTANLSVCVQEILTHGRKY